MARQTIYPFFIPMEGCPHRCVFCDQRAISGQQQGPDREQIRGFLAQLPEDSYGELAFYGGSFTCLPRERQSYYLDAAAPFLQSGRLSGIRVSTRPDGIDTDTCAFLKEKGVVTVELGVQSFRDSVLRQSGRGYDSACAVEACRCVWESELVLGVQLMTGLPGDKADWDAEAVELAADAGAELLRIYPTLVLEHTPLAELWRRGEYRPQTLDEALDTGARMYRRAVARKLTLLRLGLNPSTELEAALLAGPYHPAFGGLVKERLCRMQIDALLRDVPKDESGCLLFAKSEIPLVFGDQRRGMLYLAKNYPNLALLPRPDFAPGQLRYSGASGERSLSREEFCQSK